LSLRVVDPGVIWLDWAPGIEIDGDLARTAMRAVDDLNAGGHRPLLVDMTGTAVFSRDARKVFSQPCSAPRIALVGTSPVDRVIANFALGMFANPVPTRFFTSEAAALAWLSDGAGES
jgi:hypothetical protein